VIKEIAMSLVTGLVLGLLIMVLGAAAMAAFAMYLAHRQERDQTHDGRKL